MAVTIPRFLPSLGFVEVRKGLPLDVDASPFGSGRFAPTAIQATLAASDGLVAVLPPKRQLRMMEHAANLRGAIGVKVTYSRQQRYP